MYCSWIDCVYVADRLHDQELFQVGDVRLNYAASDLGRLAPSIFTAFNAALWGGTSTGGDLPFFSIDHHYAWTTAAAKSPRSSSPSWWASWASSRCR